MRNAFLLSTVVFAFLAGDIPPDTVIEGHLLVESAEGYHGHPGTVLSAVRVLDEPNAIASVQRLALRPEFPMDAEAGFGPCLTFQGKMQALGPDMDFGHICFRLNEAMGTEMVIFLRGSDGQFRQVLRLDAEPSSFPDLDVP